MIQSIRPTDPENIMWHLNVYVGGLLAGWLASAEDASFTYLEVNFMMNRNKAYLLTLVLRPGGYDVSIDPWQSEGGKRALEHLDHVSWWSRFHYTKPSDKKEISDDNPGTSDSTIITTPLGLITGSIVPTPETLASSSTAKGSKGNIVPRKFIRCWSLIYTFESAVPWIGSGSKDSGRRPDVSIKSVKQGSFLGMESCLAAAGQQLRRCWSLAF